MRRTMNLVRNRRGAVAVLAALSLVALLGITALAVDLSMLKKVRAEAQRAADAAALGGASAFMDLEWDKATPEAKTRARQVAAANYMQRTAVQTTGCVDDNNRVTCAELVVDVLPAERKVRAWVRRENVPTWFARVIGVNAVSVSAKAAAEATSAGESKCVMPFFWPDLWWDPMVLEQSKVKGDANGNRWPDPESGQGNDKIPEEDWGWEGQGVKGDHYRRFEDPNGTGAESGLGSDWRNDLVLNGAKYYRDAGRRMVFYPRAGDASMPGNYDLWIPPGSASSGGQAVKDAITKCNETPIVLGQPYAWNKPGGTRGPVMDGLEELFDRDPNARWEEFPDNSRPGGYTAGQVAGSSYGASWRESPRVVIMPLLHPDFFQGGRTEIQFNNMALMFLDARPDRAREGASFRFIKFAAGSGGSGPNAGSLVKILRLVE